MKTCDVHVHSIGSNRVIPANSATKEYNIPESYVNAEHQYQLAKSRGRDYVTLSDHNIITEAKKLVELHPKDCFMSCEYEVKGPSGYQDLEVLVLGLSEELHKELLIVRQYGDKEFSELVKQEKKPHSWAHPAYPVNPKGPKITVKDLERGKEYYDVLEGINGDAMRGNELAQIIANAWNIPMSGGSDDHAGLYTGLTYTVAPEANSLEEFLRHFAEGKIKAAGEWGSMQKGYQIMLAIGKQFVASEKDRRSEMGYVNYFKKNPLRFFELILVPPMLPFFLNVSSRKYREILEKRTLRLEDEFFDHLHSTYIIARRECVRELEKRQEEEFATLKAMVKSTSEYITKHTFFEKIINWLLRNNRSVQNEFDLPNSYLLEKTNTKKEK